LKKRIVNKISIFVITFLITISCFAQPELKTIRLSEDNEAWLNQDIAEAIKLTRTIAESPDADNVSVYNLAYLYFLDGKIRSALTYAQKSIDIDETYPYPYILIAKIYAESGNLIGALSLLKRALKDNSNNFDVLFELGKIYQLRKDYALAEDIYLDLWNEHKENVALNVAIASMYREQKKYDQAKEFLQENGAIYPESNFLIEKEKLYRELGDKVQAAETLVQLCKDFPYSQRIKTYEDTLKLVYNDTSLVKIDSLPNYNYKINPNESLNYKVKYGFITLGWLNIRIEEEQIIEGKRVFPIIFYVNSNPSFDFILSLHHVYESYIDVNTMNAIKSRLYTPDEANYLIRNYYFDYDKNIFTSYGIHADGRFRRVIKDLPRTAQDPTSMLYFARGVISNRMGGTTTVVIDEEYKYGHIKYLNETEELDIGDEEIEALKIFARADFNGIAGMNGDAWGWFSPDKEYVPLKGKIKIIVGSITVEVEDGEN
jgi:tetratricopeptide (TPR) repeat protein